MSSEIVKAALDDLGRLKARLLKLKASYDAERGPVPEPLKKANGRLTDAGIKYVREMLDAGKTDTQIAAGLSVTPAAIRPHRAKYAAEKAPAPKRKARR